MANKYHVNNETGRVNICRANYRRCPIASEGEHFDDRESARNYLLQNAKANHQTFNRLKKKTPLKKSGQKVSKEITNDKRKTLPFPSPLTSEQSRRNMEYLLDGNTPRYKSNIDINQMYEDYVNIPASASELDESKFTLRSDGKTFNSFEGGGQNGMRYESYRRAPNGFYLTKSTKGGYIVYSNMNRIMGSANTIKDAKEYLKYEHVGDTSIYRFENSDGAGPFTAKNFQEVEGYDSYEEFADANRIVNPNPKYEDLGGKFVQTFAKANIYKRVSYGCETRNSLAGWFPETLIKFKDFKMVEYRVPMRDVVIGESQVVFANDSAVKVS